ncbi:Imm5 family immunity protein [Mucilaginibacter sp. KACC 22063]|uniref:Imm5 family immunity protein n=1 Tax=Mucilaginibacter sp. KACC 22063 TaxID=3025666 RepID=UPI002366896D|nr:Imm5 family immunity protein [Mucilaginibacter sp. KACC 22063]WDF54385.1 Imm5 family immunity protein [Mucilaginibacter sp. KACC 22063]
MIPIEKINHYKAIIEANPIHHFARVSRNEFLAGLDKKQAFILVLNTAINTFNQVYSIHIDEKRMADLVDLLKVFIAGAKSKEEVLKDLHLMHTYLENRLGEDNFESVYSGLSIVFAGYEILKDSLTSNPIDEFNDEPESWSSSFYASLAFNGGAEDLENINPQKNKLFWLAFLDNGSKESDSTELLSIKIANDSFNSSKEIPLRKQTTNLTEEEIKLREPINSFFLDLLQKEQFSELKLECYIIANQSSNVAFYKKSASANYEKYDNTKLYLMLKKNDIVSILRQLREVMYQKSPNEGAWYQLTIVLSQITAPVYQFSYDDKLEFFNTWIDEQVFAEDFVMHKRSDEYTPGWLGNIVKLYSK